MRSRSRQFRSSLSHGRTLWRDSGHLKFLMAANRLNASIPLADKKSCLPAGDYQRQNSPVFFEVGQIVVGEKHLAARPAHKCSQGRQALGCDILLVAPNRKYPDLILVSHAEQQAAGLIQRPFERRRPSERYGPRDP